MAMCDCIDSSVKEKKMAAGNVYIFKGTDEDGDFILASWTGQHIIFHDDLDKFSLQ